MKKYGIAVISLLLFAYGAFRLGISSLLLSQFAGIIVDVDLQEALTTIETFMGEMNATSLVSFSVLGYVAYLWIMAAFLVVGAVGCFKRMNIGAICVSMFLTLYALLFINFQTINPKIYHPLIIAVLFGAYLWLKKKEVSPSDKAELSTS